MEVTIAQVCQLVGCCWVVNTFWKIISQC
jgi:hypothetical protein